MGNAENTDEYSAHERSILFSDIVASTAALERVGNRQWSDVIRHHRRSIGAVSLRRRGQVVGFTGDGFMVAFEREIDAVNCALRLQQALHIQNEVGVRLGVASGEVISVGPDFVGLAVNLAARLCDMSLGGELTIADECYYRAAQHQPLPLLERRWASVRGLSEDRPIRVSPAPTPPWLA